jgi:hypothetical protein
MDFTSARSASMGGASSGRRSALTIHYAIVVMSSSLVLRVGVQAGVPRRSPLGAGAAGKLGEGSVRKNRTDKGDSGDLRQLERSLNSDRPDPEEGRRLIKALLAIKDAEVRRALIEFAEALAREKV